MAVIKVSLELFYHALQEKFLLPNPIRNLWTESDCLAGFHVVEILTHIDGFRSLEYAVPIYQKDPAGNVTLLRIEHVGQSDATFQIP